MKKYRGTKLEPLAIALAKKVNGEKSHSIKVVKYFFIHVNYSSPSHSPQCGRGDEGFYSPLQ